MKMRGKRQSNPTGGAGTGNMRHCNCIECRNIIGVWRAEEKREAAAEIADQLADMMVEES